MRPTHQQYGIATLLLFSILSAGCNTEPKTVEPVVITPPKTGFPLLSAQHLDGRWQYLFCRPGRHVVPDRHGGHHQTKRSASGGISTIYGQHGFNVGLLMRRWRP